MTDIAILIAVALAAGVIGWFAAKADSGAWNAIRFAKIDGEMRVLQMDLERMATVVRSRAPRDQFEEFRTGQLEVNAGQVQINAEMLRVMTGAKKTIVPAGVRVSFGPAGRD